MFQVLSQGGKIIPGLSSHAGLGDYVLERTGLLICGGVNRRGTQEYIGQLRETWRVAQLSRALAAVEEDLEFSS